MSNGRTASGAAGVCLACMQKERDLEQLAGSLQHAIELGDALRLAYEELLNDVAAGQAGVTPEDLLHEEPT